MPETGTDRRCQGRRAAGSVHDELWEQPRDEPEQAQHS